MHPHDGWFQLMYCTRNNMTLFTKSLWHFFKYLFITIVFKSTHWKSLRDKFSIIHRLGQFVSFYSCYFTLRFFFTAIFFLFFCTYIFLFKGKLKKSLRSLVSFFFRNDEKLFLNFSIFLPFFLLILLLFFYASQKRKIISFVAHSLHIFHSTLFLLFDQRNYLSQVVLALSPFKLN